MSQWYGHPRVLGIPILKHLVIWASPVTLTQIAKVIWEGDSPITRVLGMERPKTRGCPCHCNTEDVDKRSGYEIRTVLETLLQIQAQPPGNWVKINLVPRSLVDKAEGEIWSSKKIQFFFIVLIESEWRECCLLRALWRVQFILCKVFHWRSSFPSQYNL